MADYTRRNPLVDESTDADGTRTATVAKLGRAHHISQEGRMPAFIGLAKATGGYYMENEAGLPLSEAMVKARMNYRVEFQDTIAVPEEVKETVISMDGVTTETKTVITTYPFRGTRAVWDGDPQPVGLGMVKSRYQLIQPSEAGELGEAIMFHAAGSQVVAGGIYGEPNGAKSYLAFKLPDGFTVGGQDRHDMYLTILNSYDGSTSISGLLAPIRLDCTNMTTVTFGKKVANQFAFRHTGDVSDKIKQAREALGVAEEWTELWKRESERLLAVPLAGAELELYLEKVLPTPGSVTTRQGEKNWSDKRFHMKQIITEADTCAFGRGTAYAALQGVQEWADWGTDTRRKGTDGLITRFTRILDGTDTEKIKLRAAELLNV